MNAKLGPAHSGTLEVAIDPKRVKEFEGFGNTLYVIGGLIDPQGKQLDFSGHYRHFVSDQNEGIKGLFIDPHFGEDISCILIGKESPHLLDFKVKPKNTRHGVHYVFDLSKHLARDFVQWDGHCTYKDKKTPVQCNVTAYHNRSLL